MGPCYWCHLVIYQNCQNDQLHLDPGVDGVKRLRLTPKLFDWLVDASHFFWRRRRGSFSTAITTRLIWKISRVVATSAHVPTTSDHVRSLEKGGKNPVRAHSIEPHSSHSHGISKGPMGPTEILVTYSPLVQYCKTYACRPSDWCTCVYVCGLSHTGMIMSTATAHESVTSSNISTSETTRNTCLLSTAGHFTADIPAPDRLQID